MVAAADSAPVIAIWTPDAKKGSTKSVRQLSRVQECSHKCGIRTSCISDYAKMISRVPWSGIAVVCRTSNGSFNEISLFANQLTDTR